MCPIQNRSGPIGIGEAFLKIGSAGDDFKNVISRANTASIIDIIKSYNVDIDLYHKKIICPFLFHQGGKEKTPSFYIYPDTNTFYCFGCKHSGGPVDFVSLINEITKISAAHKIIKGFQVDELNNDLTNDYVSNNDSIIEFSNTIRDFLFTHTDAHALAHAEKICCIFDKITKRNKLDNKGVKVVIEKLIKELGVYTCL